MNAELYFPPATPCVACLSSNRNMYRVNDEESKQMFRSFLDSFEYSNTIQVCYECHRRLQNAVQFKKQVNDAHKYLLGFTKDNIPPTTLSTLQITKTDIFDWTPDTDITTNGTTSQKTVSKHRTKKKNSKKEKERKNDEVLSDIQTIFDTNSHNSFDIIEKSCSLENLDTTLEDNEESSFQNSDIESNALLNNLNWDVKKVKKEPLEDKIEQVMLDRNEDDSFNDSDEEPLYNIKMVKNMKVKKEKKVSKPRERSAGVVRAAWVTNKLTALNVPPGYIDVVVLTWEQVEQERQKLLSSPGYSQQQFHCPHCVVGFNHRFKLDAHMNKHAPEAGEFECEICKTRFKSNSALLCHRRRHRTRWRCAQCGALYSRAGVAADHAARAHAACVPAHRCHLCAHTDTSLSKLRAHLRTHAARQHCDQCGKTFLDRAALRTHLFIHTEQKDFSCNECNKRFRFKKALEIHLESHQPSQLLYCRECDMNFKNRISFYHHINYSMKHIHPDKIKYACEYCPRRFSKPSRLQEHRLSIHLKLAPHRCTLESCTFASASRSALRTHTRMIHKHKRLERKYVCHTCGKAYTTNKILEGHIRSHTGERPFHCSRCPSTFSHSAALYNHNKLVHKVPFVRRRKPPPPEWTPESRGGEAPNHLTTDNA